MLFGTNMTILVLAPHTDDAEFGVGGTMHKLIADGNRVVQVAFSSAAQINEHGTRNEMLEKEVRGASELLGILPEHLHIHDFQVREFDKQRQKILDLMLYYKRKYNPDVVFVPCGHDVHQDHGVIYSESLRAFKHQTLLGYELPWNLYKFDYQLFSHLNDMDLAMKQRAISEYKSQLHRVYADPEYIKSLAITRGVQANTKYAETFECIRINIK